MKVRDLFDIEDLDIDVCDDYDERCYIAFVSGFRLTLDGMERFKDALDVDVTLHTNGYGDDWYSGTLHCNTAKEAQACQELFFAIAGFCSDSDYDIWFKEI